MSTPRDHYEARLREHDVELDRLARLSQGISLARVATFLLAAASAAAGYFSDARSVGVVAPMLLGAFVGLVIWHARVALREERTRAARLFCERGLARADNALEGLPPRGDRFKAEPHPFAHDLDLVGKQSLLSALDAMETDLSEERLFRWLGEPADVAEIDARKQAVHDLSPRTALREALFVQARKTNGTRNELERFVAWCEAQPTALSRGPATALGIALPLVTLTTALVGDRAGLPEQAWTLPLAVQWVISLWFAGRQGSSLDVATRGASALGAFGGLLERLSSEKLDARRLADLEQRLSLGDASAARALRSLETIAGWAEARESGFFRLVIAPLVMYDLHLTVALARWRESFGKQVRTWLDDVGDLLALSSMATYAFDNPDFAAAEVTDGPLRFDAEALVHPLLPRSARVGNDLTLAGPGTALLVTGSNMSGKSTLMRSIGTAIVLACAGAPVPCKRLRCSPAAVRSSMRVSDSLSSGVSHFYAELLALKRVTADAEHRPVVFLLDEILHGTNSKERIVGAKAVIKHLLEKGAMGAVSTHDLGLAELAGELPGKVRLVHLLEQATGDEMTFDYKLRDGALTAGNALRLMRRLGLPVGDDEPHSR